MPMLVKGRVRPLTDCTIKMINHQKALLARDTQRPHEPPLVDLAAYAGLNSSEVKTLRDWLSNWLIVHAQ